jgi:hypothetical protein
VVDWGCVTAWLLLLAAAAPTHAAAGSAAAPSPLTWRCAAAGFVVVEVAVVAVLSCLLAQLLLRLLLP